MTWSPIGENFYLNDANTIQEFRGETAPHLRELNAHHRYEGEDQRPELKHLALSPDGSWLCSSDSLRKTVTSLIGRTPPSLESMESKYQRIGGLTVSKNDDITPRNPPALPQWK